VGSRHFAVLVVAEPAMVGHPFPNAFEVDGQAPMSAAYLRNCSRQAVPCSVQTGLLRRGRGAYGGFPNTSWVIAPGDLGIGVYLRDPRLKVCKGRVRIRIVRTLTLNFAGDSELQVTVSR
jgi:hypothetical protein